LDEADDCCEGGLTQIDPLELAVLAIDVSHQQLYDLGEVVGKTVFLLFLTGEARQLLGQNLEC